MKITWISAGFFSVLLLAVLPLLGQEGLVTENRFVTLLKPKYEEGFIHLSFEPVQNENLRYRVYRSTKPIISAADIEGADLVAEITAEDIPLRDEPPAEGHFYYAVTVTEEFPELVPYLNTTTKPVDYAPLAEVIESFETRRLGDERAIIRFTPARPEYSYNLYTSSVPIKELDEAELAASVSGADGQFEIRVAQDSPLFLAITAINRLGVENETLIPGQNVTLAPLEPVPKPPEVEEEEEPKVEKPPPTPPPTPPRALLDRALRKSFFQGRYTEALERFEDLIRRNDLTSSERAEAHFYAGQCCFYLGDYRKAVKYFVLSKEIEEFVRPADVWIERSLNKIR
jgi:tetratricopeptide (TPR) repeat protein